MSKIEKDNIALAITDGFINAEELKQVLVDIYMDYTEMFMQIYNNETVDTEQANSNLCVLRSMINEL